jgi:predicted transcriptional regulator
MVAMPREVSAYLLAVKCQPSGRVAQSALRLYWTPGDHLGGHSGVQLLSERKIDYFRTFLDSMKREQPEGLDPANEVLKALRGGALQAKNLIPFAGNSVTRFIEISEQLIEQSWVQKKDPDVFALTDKGRRLRPFWSRPGPQRRRPQRSRPRNGSNSGCKAIAGSLERRGFGPLHEALASPWAVGVSFS